MKAYIYQIRNTKTEKRYIGSSVEIEKRRTRHFGDLEKGIHHNRYLQRSYNKHGKEYFVFEIVEEHDITDESEIRIIEETFLLQDGLYNIGKNASGGDNLSRHPDKKDIIQRRSNTVHNNIKGMSEQERSDKWGRIGDKNGMWGKTHSESVKNKSQNIMRQNHVLGLIPSRKGKTNEELFGIDIANMISKKLSDYRKTCTGEKNSFYGKHHTDDFKRRASVRRKEQRQSMSLIDKLNHPQMKPIIAEGRLFLGASEAARALNCTAGNITYKLKSAKYKNYFYIEKEQLLPLIESGKLTVDNIDDFKYDDFVIENYQFHPTIKAKVSV